MTSSTPPNPLNSQVSFENITHIQHDLYRTAWAQIFLPSIVLESERWSALSVVTGAGGKNVTLYESREVYNGPIAYVVQSAYGEGLQEGFDAQGKALKALVES